MLEAFPKLLRKAKRIAPTITHIWLDKGYTGQTVADAAARASVSVEVVSRPKPDHGFIVQPRRWVVERTNGWINHCRRLDRHYEITIAAHEGFLYLSQITLLLTTTRPQPVARHALGGPATEATPLPPKPITSSISGSRTGSERGSNMAATLERAVEASEIVDALKSFGVTQGDVASVTHVSDRAVRAWRTGDIRPDRYDRLAQLRDLVLLLSDSLTPRGVGQWLHAQNRLLNGERPVDLLAEDRYHEVHSAAEGFVAGSYV